MMDNPLRYLLDTNILSDIARYLRGPVARRMAAIGAEQIGVSIIVACEIRFGLVKRPMPRLKQHLEQVLDSLTVLDLKPPVEEHYADIRNTL